MKEDGRRLDVYAETCGVASDVAWTRGRFRCWRSRRKCAVRARVANKLGPARYVTVQPGVVPLHGQERRGDW